MKEVYSQRVVSHVVSAAVLTLLIASTAIASTNLVSRPFGFTRVTLMPGEQKLVSTPFWALNNDDSINAVLKNQMTGASDETNADLVLVWNTSIPQYLKAVKADKTGDSAKDGKWFDNFLSWSPSPIKLTPGSGFFLINRQSVTQQVFLAGEVVLEEETDLSLPSGLSLFGFPYSSAGTLDGLDKNDQITRQDGQAVERSLNLGEGYWYLRKAMDSLTWKTIRPYSNPFPANDGPPRVLSLTPSSDGSNIVLSIETAGVAGERLDVYYQCLGPTNAFSAETGWSVAALDIEVGGAKLMTWTDSLPEDDPAGASTKVYLVARSDIDANGDGIPDCRQKFGGVTSWTPDKNGDQKMMPGVDEGTNTFGVVTSNGTEVVRIPLFEKKRQVCVIYVNKMIGGDHLSGRWPVVVGSDGPKKTIAAGLAETGPGDTLVIHSGRYAEDADFSGRALTVQIQGHVDLSGPRAMPPPAASPGPSPMTNSWERP